MKKAKAVQCARRLHSLFCLSRFVPAVLCAIGFRGPENSQYFRKNSQYFRKNNPYFRNFCPYFCFCGSGGLQISGRRKTVSAEPVMEQTGGMQWGILYFLFFCADNC